MHENSNFTYQKFIDKYDKIDWAIQAKIIGADADYELMKDLESLKNNLDNSFQYEKIDDFL